MAQQPSSSSNSVTSSLATTPPTLGRGRIVGRFSDPFISRQQADRILMFLQQPNSFDWSGRITIADVHRDLSKHFAVALDTRALEEIGLSSDDILHPGDSPPRSSSTQPVLQDDPFGGARKATPKKRSVESQKDAPVTSQRWWDSGSKSLQIQSQSTVSNGARLMHFLARADLTLHLHNGQLQITTLEQAEQNGCVRIYDVTPLVNNEDRSRQDLPRQVGYPGVHGYGYSGSTLGDVIQTTIVPDTWEMLGGPSTLTEYSTARRHWMVISTTLVIHWKVEELLNRLND